MRRLLVCVLVVCCLMGLCACGNEQGTTKQTETETTAPVDNTPPERKTAKDGTTYIVYVQNKGEYANDYEGIYHTEVFNGKDYKILVPNTPQFENKGVMEGGHYENFRRKFLLPSQSINLSSNYVVISHMLEADTQCEARVASVKETSENSIEIVFEKKIPESKWSDEVNSGYLIAVPIDKKYEKVEIIELISKEEFEKIQQQEENQVND